MNCWVQCKRWKSTGRFNATAVSRQQAESPPTRQDWCSCARSLCNLRKTTFIWMSDNQFGRCIAWIWLFGELEGTPWIADWSPPPPKKHKKSTTQPDSEGFLGQMIFPHCKVGESSKLSQNFHGNFWVVSGSILYHWATLSRPPFSFDAKMRLETWQQVQTSWRDRFHNTCNPHKHTNPHKYVMQQTAKTAFNLTMSWSIHTSKVKGQATWLRKGASKETPKLGERLCGIYEMLVYFIVLLHVEDKNSRIAFNCCRFIDFAENTSFFGRLFSFSWFHALDGDLQRLGPSLCSWDCHLPDGLWRIRSLTHRMTRKGGTEL